MTEPSGTMALVEAVREMVDDYCGGSTILRLADAAEREFNRAEKAVELARAMFDCHLSIREGGGRISEMTLLSWNRRLEAL